MRAIILFALLLSGACGSADAADQADSPAIRLLEDIHAGRPVHTVEGGPELSGLELSEIAKLAGCLPTSDRHQDALVPIIDWNCAENPDDSRTVTLYMSDDGVEDLLIQPLAANFRPAALAATSEALPSRSAITRRFLLAVRTGDDPTLGGLIPITEIQMARLEVAHGEKPRQMSGSDRTSVVHLWIDAISKLGMPLITDLRFDQDGRPIGLVISHGMRR